MTASYIIYVRRQQNLDIRHAARRHSITNISTLYRQNGLLTIHIHPQLIIERTQHIEQVQVYMVQSIFYYQDSRNVYTQVGTDTFYHIINLSIRLMTWELLLDFRTLGFMAGILRVFL